MCVNSKLRVNVGALALWSRLKITLDGKPFVGSPSEFFDALNWNYYDDKSNGLRSSVEWSEFLSRSSATLNGFAYSIFAEIKCNKCRECISDKVSNLQSRSVLEASQAKSMFFVTLTYDDAHLPTNSAGVVTLAPLHITTFLKHTRNTFERLPDNHPLHGIKFRVVTCGEYGGHTHRPHYHLIVFADKYINPRRYQHFNYHFTKRWTCNLVLKRYKSPDIYVNLPHNSASSLNRSLSEGKGLESLIPKYTYSNMGIDSLSGYVASDNPLYRGYVCKFEFCRNVVASAKYIMKYIAKWKLDEDTEYYNPLDPLSNENLPHKPFIKTPKRIALGNTALADDNIVNSVLQSRDNKISVRLQSTGGLVNATYVTTISIPQEFKNAICRPFSRCFPSAGLAVHVIRDAVNQLNRHKMYYDYQSMTKTMNDLGEVKSSIEEILRNCKKGAISPLFAKWIYNNLPQIESAFTDSRTYPYDFADNCMRNYQSELAQLHSYLFASPSACLYVLGRLLPVYGELPTYDEYCEFIVDRFMMFGSNKRTPSEIQQSALKKRRKSDSLFNSKFNFDE